MPPLKFTCLLVACLLAPGIALADTTTPANRSTLRFTAIPAEQSHVTMSHPIVAEHPRAYLYPSGFACGGVAIGDVNGDDRPDLFFTSGPEVNRLYVQTEKPLVFRDATDEAGVSGKMAGGIIPWAVGAAMADLNQDGHLDIYVCNYDAPNQLFINDGQGHFIEQAREWGLAIVDASLMPAFMDIDGSGELALYLLTNRYERPGGRPQNPPVAVVDGVPRVLPEFQKYYGLKRIGPSNYQMDFVGRPDRLLVVEHDEAGRRVYRDVSRQAGLLSDGAHGLSATWLDYDNDGRPDLYVCNDFTDPDWLYRNEGKGSDGTVRFKNAIADVAPITTWSSMGADAADINNDGLVDLVTGDMASSTHFDAMINTGAVGERLDTLLNSWPRQTMRNMMFLNTGAGRFREAAYLAGIAATDWTWAVKLADLDNDGRVDLFVTNGVSRNYTDADFPFSTQMYIGRTDWDLKHDQPPRKERNLAFRNLDGLRFENVSRSWGLDHLGMSYAAAYGDLDRDGDLDLVVCNLDETVSIYRNEGVKDHHWLEVRLRGAASHPQGWGARVRLKTDSGRRGDSPAASWRTRYMNPATGFLSCNDPVLHFGLGPEEKIESLEVHWPSGRFQRVENVAVDQLLTLIEPATDSRVAEAPREHLAPLFVHVSNIGLDFRHQEAPFDDYAREPLLPGKLSQPGPGIAVGDANNDTRDDVYFGGAAGQPAVLFVRQQNGRFAPVDGPWQADAQCEDMGAVWFDADGDGRLDLYVVSGGVEGSPGDAVFEDRLYLNTTQPDAPVSFAKAPPGSLPDTRAAGSVACAADFDRDGDLDLFVGSRSIPGSYPQTPRSLLLRNDSKPGRPKFADVADQLAPGLAKAGLVTAALWSDADTDGYPDLLVTCEWGPVRVFHNRRGTLVEQTQAARLAERIGWWNGIAAGDFDGDAKIDYLVTNVGLNTKYGQGGRAHPAILLAGDVMQTGGYELVEAKVDERRLLPVRSRSAISTAIPQLWQKFPTFRAYAAAHLMQIFDKDALRKSRVLSANEFRTGLLVNRSTPGKLAFEWKPLADIAQISPGFGIAVADFSGDGRPDAAIAQNLFTREPETGLWRGGVGQLLCATASGAARTSHAVRGSPAPAPAAQAAQRQLLDPVPPIESGIVMPGDAKGAATIDLDGDARPDLVIAQNDDAAVTLRNQSASSWLSLRLVGSTGTAAIGSRVTIHFGDGSNSASELYAGSGYLSQSAPEIYVGLDGPVPRRAEVRWPSGKSQMVSLEGKSGRITLKERLAPQAERDSP